MKSKSNEQQNIEIAEIKKDVCWIKKEILEIKGQVFNHLPSQIDDLKNKIVVGFLIGIVSIIVVQIILDLFK